MTHLMALAGVFLISFSAIFYRLAAVSPSTAAFFRAAYAVPLLLVIWWFFRSRDHRTFSTRLLAVFAGFFLGIDMWFWHRAIELIGAGLATILGNTQVVFVGILAWLIHGERPRLVAVFLIPVVFLGVILITGLGRQDAYGEDPVMGAVLGILTAITYALYLLILRHASRAKGPPSGPLLDATAGAAFAVLIAGLVDGTLDFTITWPAHGWLFALAAGSQVGGWLLISTALPRLPALETSIMLLVQPMLTMLWAWILFAEQLSGLQFMGIFLVLLGVGSLSVFGPVAPTKTAEAVAGPATELE